MPTAQTIGVSAATNVTPVSLELGGKSPLLVVDDADLDLAVDIAVGQFDNSGQVCLAAVRILVQEGVAAEFRERFLAKAATVVQGDSADEATGIGPLVNRTHFDQVDGFVTRAKADEASRRELNEGREISLVPGLHRIRAEKLEELDYDTVIVLDSHWFATVEPILTSQPLRSGLFTAEELLRGMFRIPDEWRGDPELADAIAAETDGADTWITPIDDPYLPLYYPSVNLWSYLGKGLDKQWISISVCQSGETDDSLRVGRAIAAASTRVDRKVIIVATGSMSYTCHKLKDVGKHESSDPSHLISPKARDMDHERLGWFFEGRHDRVLETMPEFLSVRPEGVFAPYLMMAAALGENDFSATGVQYGDYENAIGTSQVHVWFDRPEGGRVAPRPTTTSA